MTRSASIPTASGIGPTKIPSPRRPTLSSASSVARNTARSTPWPSTSSATPSRRATLEHPLHVSLRAPRTPPRLLRQAADDQLQRVAGPPSGAAAHVGCPGGSSRSARAAFVVALAERLEPPGQPTWAAHARWAGRVLELVIGGLAQQARWNPEEQRAAERVERVLERLARLDGVADDVEGHGVDRRRFPASCSLTRAAYGPATVGRRRGLRRPDPAGRRDRRRPRHRPRPGRGRPARGSGRRPAAVGPHAPHARRRARPPRPSDGAAPPPAPRRRRRRAADPGGQPAARRPAHRQRPLRLALGCPGWSGRPRPAPSATPRSTRACDDGLPPATEQEASLTDLQRIRSTGHPLDAHPLAHGDQALHRALTLIDGRASDELTAYDGNLASLAAEGVDLSPHQPVAPTALEAWVRCPFSYFVRHVLGVRELEALQEELSLRPADRGVLVHAVLESVVGELIRSGDVPEPDQPWSISAAARLVAVLEARCEATEAESEVGPALHWQLEQRRLRRRLDGFVELDLAAGGARSAPGGHGAPVRHGAALRHHPARRSDAGPARGDRSRRRRPGSAGRHRLQDGSGTVEPDRPVHRPGPALQLPVYALAARDLLERPDVEVVAEYWHLQDRHDERKRLPIDVDPRTLARLAEVVAAIVDGIGAGLFVPHPDEPDPWRRARCAYCDPDGADTATLWGQWQHKRRDPARRLPAPGRRPGGRRDRARRHRSRTMSEPGSRAAKTEDAASEWPERPRAEIDERAEPANGPSGREAG